VDSGNWTVTAHGNIPYGGSLRAKRILMANMTKYETTPPYFYDNAIYSAGDVDINGASYDVDGDVYYGTCNDYNSNSICDAEENTVNIDGNVTYEPTISPLARLNFDQLRAISQSQGNYHNSTQLGGPFPASFFMPDGTTPNVVFLEGSLDLSGKTQVGGFYVVGGDVVYDATLSGNVRVNGAIYTLGRFTINGGGNVLNVDGGVWSGQTTTLNGNAKIAYNSTYMDAIDGLDIDTEIQITSWRDTQNPYALSP
jgi:hypothetical protein